MAYVNLGQVVYPVGSFYCSTQKTSPASIFGGTWEQLRDLDPLLATIDDNSVGKYVGYRYLPMEALPPHWHPIANMQSNYPSPDEHQKRFVKMFRQRKIVSGDAGGNGWLLASDDERGIDEIQTSIDEALFASTIVNGILGRQQIPLQIEGYGTYIWHRTS